MGSDHSGLVAPSLGTGPLRQLGLLLAAVIAIVVVAACSAGEPVSSASTTPAPDTASPSRPASFVPSTALATLGTIRPSAAPKTTIEPNAPSSGTTVTLIAKGNRWNVTSVTVPANRTWVLVVDNEDANVRHQLEFSGAAFPGYEPIPLFAGIDTRTATVPGLPSGTYTFVCIIHPDTMTGTLTIK